jgi:hypothetical protein
MPAEVLSTMIVARPSMEAIGRYWFDKLTVLRIESSILSNSSSCQHKKNVTIEGMMLVLVKGLTFHDKNSEIDIHTFSLLKQSMLLR